jgi:hypothetical protein
LYASDHTDAGTPVNARFNPGRGACSRIGHFSPPLRRGIAGSQAGSKGRRQRERPATSSRREFLPHPRKNQQFHRQKEQPHGDPGPLAVENRREDAGIPAILRPAARLSAVQ